jgi:hypothetical protein
MVWAPAACTLPTAEQPLRVAEFDSLFADAVRTVERVSDTQLTLLLEPAAGRADLIRDLIRRETQCCSFFTFVLAGGDLLRLEVTVPPAHVQVLDGLADRASRARGAVS